MKRQLIIGMFAVALTFAACGNKTTSMVRDMNTLSFTTEQAAFMSAIACNEAKADYVALAQAIDKGLDAGLTVSQVKDEVIDISPCSLDSSFASSSPVFCMMYSAYKLNKQSDNIQP